LKRMARPHDVDVIYGLVEDLRRAMPDIALRSTFIVGFPGETEAEFAALLDLMRTIRFDKVGIFAYSAEDGTPAAAMPDHVPPAEIAERRERAMLLQQELSLLRNRALVGTTARVLIDGAGDGLSVGRTYRDAPEIDGLVFLAGEHPVGQFVPARITGAREYDLVAEVCPSAV
ncbi:MAG: TRAM domain-containing protein, partial [Chloroflexota bacterium]